MPSYLQHLRKQTQVDIDSFDFEVVQESWGCIDATSNQVEIYNQISRPSNRALLETSVKTALEVSHLFPDCDQTQVAADACAVSLASRMSTKVPGLIHVMADSKHAFDCDALVAQGRRFRRIIQTIAPSFDISRFVMKVPATWEGLQACRHLKAEGIPTLATIVFGIEQAILAGEVGCVSVSPFLHELKAHFDKDFEDDGPYTKVSVQSEVYFKRHALPTKVKACANLGADEAMVLPGIGAFTILPEDLKDLSRKEWDRTPISQNSNGHLTEMTCDYVPLYIDNESKFRCDFAHANKGKNQYRVMQALAIFGDFQDKLLALMRKTVAEVSKASQ